MDRRINPVPGRRKCAPEGSKPLENPVKRVAWQNSSRGSFARGVLGVACVSKLKLKFYLWYFLGWHVLDMIRHCQFGKIQ